MEESKEELLLELLGERGGGGLGGRLALLLPPEVHSFRVAELIIYCT